MRFWLVMKPSSLYFKVVIVVSYLKMLLVFSIIILAIFYINLFGSTIDHYLNFDLVK